MKPRIHGFIFWLCVMATVCWLTVAGFLEWAGATAWPAIVMAAFMVFCCWVQARQAGGEP